MTCAVVKNHVLDAPQPPFVETVAGVAATDVTTTDFIELKNKERSALIWLQTASPAPSNLPAKFEVYGVTKFTRDGDGVITAIEELTANPIASKQFCSAADWNGKTFLEIQQTHIGKGELEVGLPIVGLQVSFEGEDSVNYEVITTLFDPDFRVGENIEESLT